MKRGDYATRSKAQKYVQGRFKNGLEIVNENEMEILRNWMRRVSVEKKVLLDIGTGTGRVIDNLLSCKAKRIYALDQSRAMLDYLKEIHAKEVKNGIIKIVLAPSSRIPLKPKSINLATAFHLFKHLPDVRPSLKEVNKVLKPGGYFIFDILNTNSLVKFNLGTCYALSESQIKHILNQSGFAVKEIVYLHSLGETVYGAFGKILSIVPKTFETIINGLGLKIGTKIFILAEKNE